MSREGTDGGRADGAGAVQLSEEALAQIVAEAVAAIDGVSLVGGSGLGELLGRRSAARGVRVDLEEAAVTVDLTLGVRYGLRIPEVARQLQERVREDLERMTGLTVRAVNVHVAQILGPERPGQGRERD